MGTTFVSIDKTHGFWMEDGKLEVWLRLLALHIPEPSDHDSIEYRNESYEIRNQWLLASKGYFGGWVPHALEDFFLLPHGREIITLAMLSLRGEINHMTSPFTLEIMSLIGGEHGGTTVTKEQLIDIDDGWNDLIAEKIIATASSTARMPGSH